MAISQTVLFTVMPRGISLNGGTLPVSVVVSPRLAGADRLDAFPDFVDWTQKLVTSGLRFSFRCGTRTATAAIDTAVLQPRLWRALFNADTFVRSHAFDDYSSHGVMSFSVRESLSALKAVYQEAGVVLALPDPSDDRDPFDPESGRHGGPSVTNRDRLQAILGGLDVHWNRDNARSWRAVARHRSASGTGSRALAGPLDGEGLITAARNPGAYQSIAGPFSAFHHMPTPDRTTAGPVKVDPDAFDFHQALSALESHPELQRALGLVFDLDLPTDLVPATATATPAPLSVQSTDIAWQQPAKSPPLETACVHFAGSGVRLFCCASRAQTTAGSPMQVLGLLNLDPQRFGLAQVDVDGSMHKVITTAEIHNNPDPGRSAKPVPPEPAPHPDIYDPEATLPSIRSGGLQLYLDGRGATVIDAIQQSKAFNQALESGGAQPRPFYAEDLVRGYRLDVWESRTAKWLSLHRRKGTYAIGEDGLPFNTEDEEGFFQLAATQPAPHAPTNDKDLYVHEIIARWAGWSLSVPFPGKALSRYADPDMAIPPDGDDARYRTDEPITAFKVRATYKVVPGTLPLLRFGVRYRMRARAVDLAGNSLGVGDAIANTLALSMALPADPEGRAYLRYEPVAAPLVVIRDRIAVIGPGSAVHRLVMRTFNDAIDKDGDAAELTASDRHILPPRTSVELGERMGMFDGPDGKLKTDPATWSLAVARDEGKLATDSFQIAGKLAENVALEAGESVDPLPYLPDLLSRGAAIRDLPGTGNATVGRASPADPAAGAIAYSTLADINPRRGSATLISFNATADWQQSGGFRLALAEPTGPGNAAPAWDPAKRLLTVFLAKGQTAVVPLSSYLMPGDLKLMGQWQWLREFVDIVAIFGAQPGHLMPGKPVDLIAHVLQRAVEGGHWMISPPTLLTLVHAVQQPIGRPAFAALNLDRSEATGTGNLQTDRARGRSDPQELTPIVAARKLDETYACLLGALRTHGASTAKVNLMAEWTDPVDLPEELAPGQRHFKAPVDELPLSRLSEGYLAAPGAPPRRVGYYDPENDQIAMVRAGDRAGPAAGSELYFRDATPRHELGDTRRHIVRYTAVATSRYREYFAQDQGLDFTRTSEPVVVDVPASGRPLAPDIVYVVPTFGWQRQGDTNMKRSIRYGGGLRVWLNRPWFSSGTGELLGVALWNSANGPLNDVNRDKYKNVFTQWGMDPIWDTAPLRAAPEIRHFPDAVASDTYVSLEEASARISGSDPGRVDVVGFEPQFDADRKLWFADLTIDLLDGPTYAPFVRLALVRYQPHALDDARISRVALAQFAQLTPDRVATVTADPYHPRTLRVAVSGVAPNGPPPGGPAPDRPARPTHVQVRVQKKAPGGGELEWHDAPAAEASVTQFYEGQALFQKYLGLWVGSVTFTIAPAVGAYRLLIEEFEYISAKYAENRRAPGRLIYAEIIEVDAAMVEAGGPS
jgi:hypothetical protein